MRWSLKADGLRSLSLVLRESPPDSFEVRHGLARLRAEQALVEHTFRSNVPLFGPIMAWAREHLNTLSAKCCVRPLIDEMKSREDAGGR